MKKSRFTEEQRVAILREADKAPVPEVAGKHKVSAQAGVVLYDGEATVRFGDGLFAVPVRALWELR
jgi:putative transposase